MKKKGISLIVLVVTIIIIIILAGAIILNFTKNSPIESAKKARFLSDIDTFKSELSLYIMKKTSDNSGEYNSKVLNSNKYNVHEELKEDNTRTIIDIINSMKNTKYVDLLEVKNGVLVYIGNDEDEIGWCTEAEIKVINLELSLSAIADETTNSISGDIILRGSIVDINKITGYKVYISLKENFEDSHIIELAGELLTQNYNKTGLEFNKYYYVKVIVTMDSIEYTSEIKKVLIFKDDIAPNVQISTGITYEDSKVNSIVTIEDNEGGSGINKSGCKYILVKDMAVKYSITDEIWNNANNFSNNNFINNTTNLKLDITLDGTYYLHILATDNKGNKNTSVSNPIYTIPTARFNRFPCLTDMGPKNVGSSYLMKFYDINENNDLYYSIDRGVTWIQYPSNGVNVSASLTEVFIKLKDKVTQEDVISSTTVNVVPNQPAASIILGAAAYDSNWSSREILNKSYYYFIYVDQSAWGKRLLTSDNGRDSGLGTIGSFYDNAGNVLGNIPPASYTVIPKGTTRIAFVYWGKYSAMSFYEVTAVD